MVGRARAPAMSWPPMPHTSPSRCRPRRPRSPQLLPAPRSPPAPHTARHHGRWPRRVRPVVGRLGGPQPVLPDGLGRRPAGESRAWVAGRVGRGAWAAGGPPGAAAHPPSTPAPPLSISQVGYALSTRAAPSATGTPVALDKAAKPAPEVASAAIVPHKTKVRAVSEPREDDKWLGVHSKYSYEVETRIKAKVWGGVGGRRVGGRGGRAALPPPLLPRPSPAKRPSNPPSSSPPAHPSLRT